MQYRGTGRRRYKQPSACTSNLQRSSKPTGTGTDLILRFNSLRYSGRNMQLQQIGFALFACSVAALPAASDTKCTESDILKALAGTYSLVNTSRFAHLLHLQQITSNNRKVLSMAKTSPTPLTANTQSVFLLTQRLDG
jgi:hypothetical protein